MFKHRLLALCLALSLMLPLIPAQALAAGSGEIEKVYSTATIEDSFTDNEVLLVMMPEYNETAYTIADFSDVGCTAMEELFYDTEPGVLSRIILLTLDQNSKQNVLDAIHILEQREDIYSAEPNAVMELQIEPNDSMYSSLWAPDAISLPAAWDIETDAYYVYVGIIDSGVSSNHPDMYNINVPMSRNFIGDGTSAVSDTIGHGTMVASVIGADSNNYDGLVGVCWSVNLVSLKVVYTTYQGGEQVEICQASSVISAIQYADSVGIDILNISLGVPNANTTAFRTALASYDGLVVCAAGNGNHHLGYTPDEDTYNPPTVYPAMHNDLSNVITVGASTRSDSKASFSNYGIPWVDLFAPGDDIYVCTASGGYACVDGTSFAAPYVAGVAALVLSCNPNMTGSDLKQRICNTVDRIGVLSAYCRTSGRLNAYKALVG